MAETQISPCKTIKRVTELPHDILMFQILPRLPGRSVLVCMSVCKEWHSSLKKPMFAEIHLRHATSHQNHHMKHLVFSAGTSPCNFLTIDCEAPDDGLSVSRPFPFETSYLNMLGILSIIGSCNGLVCVGTINWNTNREFRDLILWNPLTGEYKTLSKSNNYPRECYEITIRATGLYYSSSDEDYRILRLTNDRRVYIYSLRSDSWRKVETTIPYLESISERWSSCVPFNEKLYFIKEFKEGRLSRESDSIIRFDTKTEKVIEIAIPSFANPAGTNCLSLVVLRDCLHLCVMCDVHEADSPKWCMELWRMNGDAGRDWTKVSSYCWIPCLDIGARLDLLLKSSTFRVVHLAIHLMMNGSMLMRYSMNGAFYTVDSRKLTNNKRSSYTSNGMRFPLRGKYIETFVSPNQYGERLRMVDTNHNQD